MSRELFLEFWFVVKNSSKSLAALVVKKNLENMTWRKLRCFWKSNEYEWLHVFWWKYWVIVNFPLVLTVLVLTENNVPNHLRTYLKFLNFKKVWGIAELYSFTVNTTSFWSMLFLSLFCCFSKERFFQVLRHCPISLTWQKRSGVHGVLGTMHCLLLNIWEFRVIMLSCWCLALPQVSS